MDSPEKYYRHLTWARPGLIGVKWPKLLKYCIRLWSFECDKGLQISSKNGCM